jgi:perosamine synthetase
MTDENFIPFNRSYITDEEIAGAVEAIRSGWLTMGPKTVEFEEHFGRYVGAQHSIAVNSGTAAMHLALRTVGLRPDDEVIVPTMTFTATAEVVCYFGAKPVIVDIDRDTHNIDPERIEKAVTSRTRAVLPVHYAGQPCDMDAIIEIARRHKLYIIEDAAHSFPAYYNSSIYGDRRSIGTIGDITCFSFYATKTLVAG